MGNRKAKPQCPQEPDHHLEHNEIQANLMHPEINGANDLVAEDIKNLELEESSGFHVLEIHASSIGYTALAMTMVVLAIGIAWCCCGRCFKGMYTCARKSNKKRKEKKAAQKKMDKEKNMESMEKANEQPPKEEETIQTTSIDDLGVHTAIVSAKNWKKTCEKPRKKSKKGKQRYDNIAQIARRAFKKGKSAGRKEQQKLDISWGKEVKYNTEEEWTDSPQEEDIGKKIQLAQLKEEEDSITSRYGRILRSTREDYFRGQVPPMSVYLEKKAPLFLKTPTLKTHQWDEEDFGYTFLEGHW